MWIVQTTDGTLASDFNKKGTEQGAKADAERRNKQAEALGLKTRYEAVEK
jgi:hypothetical protein